MSSTLLKTLSLTCFILLFTVPLCAQEQPLTRIAFGSCANQTYPQPIWNSVIDWNPQLFLFLGDAIYADTYDMDSMRVVYGQMNQISGYRRLKAACPILAIWDDHDYGENDGGASYTKRDEAQQIFLNFFDEPKNSKRRNTPGIYDVKTYGPPEQRIQIILLDVRYFRSTWTEDQITQKRYRAVYDPNLTMLGETQWAWLARQLQQPARIRLICSGIQIINDEHGYECWGNMPLERDRLFKLIQKTQASGVVFLTGDRHFSELSVIDG
ncbi:MAG: alkaline phosphatase D family protein, partial [bacterium]|nr:alkaline phosphatase D family protein [bacterium]